MRHSRRAVLAWLAAIPGRAHAAPCCGPITHEAVRMQAFLDGCGVDRLWQAGTQVDWQSGVPTAGWDDDASHHTHCSAFVASMAMRIGIYVLRPPDHPEKLLANAQMGWLHGAAARAAGWQPVADVVAAQRRANLGELVLAAAENPNPRRPGHIAIMRPSDVDLGTLLADGPFVCQAGERNAVAIPLREGFAGHRGAWVSGGGGTVRFFDHAVAWATM